MNRVVQFRMGKGQGVGKQTVMYSLGESANESITREHTLNFPPAQSSDNKTAYLFIYGRATLTNQFIYFGIDRIAIFWGLATQGSYDPEIPTESRFFDPPSFIILCSIVRKLPC